MRSTSRSGHVFSQVPRAEIPRSSFDRSHGHKTTFNAGLLIPIFVDEALPGDTFNLRMTAFGRLATPIFPIMDNMFLETFFFAVPYRLLWDNWERFNGAQDDPDDSTDFVVPQLFQSPVGQFFTEGTIGDYMGCPIDVGGDELNYCSFPFRAYNLIWNTWFRDQNLQDSAFIYTGDGFDFAQSGVDYQLRRRGKRHDYFTSCLPWPQKGDPVDLPLGVSAPVVTNVSDTISGAQEPLHLRKASDGSAPTNSRLLMTETTTGDLWQTTTAGSGETFGQLYPSNLQADLTTATAATINQLRQAFQIQKLLERDARGGTRYTEIIRAHFGVVSPDARLQRPEYLGGGSSFVNITPIAQTAEGTANPVGTLAAMGTVSARGHGFVKSFTEHCVVIGLVCVRADLTYQQGVNRMWSRQTRYDFYWPALSHIGEQAVLNKEIFATGGSPGTEDAGVFGYQERYAEYRYKPSMVTGAMRSAAATPLDAWHLAQDFTALPVLGDTFIQENPPVERVIAVTTEPHFIFDSYFSLRCARPMPLYGVPGNMDRF